jgi:transcriptional regulator with XRE-family HTH domain
MKKLTPFGIKVKIALVEKGLSHSEFCEVKKIPMNRFSEILYGTIPGHRYRKIIAEALGIEESA